MVSALHQETELPIGHPLDFVEQIALSQEWPFHRQSEDEIAVEISGQWCGYRLWFGWADEVGVLQLSSALDLVVGSAQQASIETLLARANEKLWLGHFEIWADENVPAFRHAQLFREGSGLSGELIEELIHIAMVECERFYPAFRFVIENGLDADTALDASLLETEGEA